MVVSVPNVELNNGISMPQIGFGVFRIPDDDTERTVLEAIECGYRSIDTASLYGNERGVGRAIASCGLPRDDLFVSTKLWNDDQGRDRARPAFDESLDRLGLDHVDLYLIHWPKPSKDLYVQTWEELETLYAQGRVRAIGVSNFQPDHLDRLLARTRVVPAVNQIELHPYFPQAQALAFHREKGILTEAWSPLGRGTDLLGNPVIAEIAGAHGVSPAKAVLGWHVARGSIPLPKSSTPVRARENLDIFGVGLTDAEVDRITALGRPDGRVADQDPAVYEEF